MTRANAKIKLNKLTTKADVGFITTKGRGDTQKSHQISRNALRG